MNKYAEINEDGKAIAIIQTQSVISEPHMIQIADEVNSIDILGKLWSDTGWVEDSSILEQKVNDYGNSVLKRLFYK